MICSGCSYAPVYDDQGNEVAKKTCPFCRAPAPTSEEEVIERERKRVDSSDPIAIFNIGCNYQDGIDGYRQDYTKALELWHRAGELGHAKSYQTIGDAYDNGEGLEVDKKKARHYYELAAMMGDTCLLYTSPSPRDA